MGSAEEPRDEAFGSVLIWPAQESLVGCGPSAFTNDAEPQALAQDRLAFTMGGRSAFFY